MHPRRQLHLPTRVDLGKNRSEAYGSRSGDAAGSTGGHQESDQLEEMTAIEDGDAR